jgi:hypothetical protein
MQIATEGVPVSIHYHHAWLIWLLYVVGAALHVTLQVSDIAAKNGWKRRAVLKAIWPAVAFRAFWSAMIFGLIWYYPLAISGALKAVGINIGQDEAEVLAIPMNNFIAGLYGLMLDSLLGYIPGLKSWLPNVTAPGGPPMANSAPEITKP